MSPRIARRVLLDIQDGEKPAGGEGPPPLSERELQILRKLERGLSYKGIAAELRVSPHTVHTHIKNIYEKVHARGRADVLRKARNLGAL
jgi:two-component system NarL family response regulator